MKAYLSNTKTRTATIKRDFKANEEGSARAALIDQALKGENKALTNTAYEVVGTFLPQLVYKNPDIEVETMVPGQPQYDGMGLGLALQSLSAQQDWVADWMQATADMLSWEGVIMVTEDDSAAPRYTQGREVLTWSGDKMTLKKGDQLTLPKMTYIDRNDFFIDSAVNRLTDARHMGHRWQEDLEVLKARARENPTMWNTGEVDSLTPDKHGLVKVIQMFVPGIIDERAKTAQVARAEADPDRDYEDANDKEIHTGTLYTLSGNWGSKEIRPPRLYRGPVCGPYVRFEGIPMPFSKCGAPHLAMTYHQLDNAARVESAAIDAIEDYESAIFATKQVAEAFANPDSEHNGVYEVPIAPDLMQHALQSFTKGGLTAENLAGIDLTSKARDRSVGMSESMSGNAASGTTATAETLADQSTSIRLSLLQEMAYRAVEKCLYVAGWIVEYSPSAIVPLPGEAIERGLERMRDAGIPIPEDAAAGSELGDMALYTGGDALKQDATRAFDAKTIKIVPMSMERTSEGVQQRRALQFVELIGQLVEMKAKAPDLDIKYIADQIGPKMNMPKLGKALPGGQVQAEGQAKTPTEQTGVPGNESGALAQP